MDQTTFVLHLALKFVVFVELLDELLIQLFGRLVAVAHDESLDPMIAHRYQVLADCLKMILNLKQVWISFKCKTKTAIDKPSETQSLAARSRSSDSQ